MGHVIKWDFYRQLGRLRNQTQPSSAALGITDPRFWQWGMIWKQPLQDQPHHTSGPYSWGGQFKMTLIYSHTNSQLEICHDGLRSLRRFEKSSNTVLGRHTTSCPACMHTHKEKTSAVTARQELIWKYNLLRAHINLCLLYSATFTENGSWASIIIYRNFLMCVCMLRCVPVNTGMHMPWSTAAAQRVVTLGAALCSPPWRQGLLSAAAYTGLIGLWALGESPASACYLTIGMLDDRTSSASSTSPQKPSLHS